MREKFYTPLHNIEISPIVRIAEQARKIESEFESRTGEKFIHLERGEIDQSTPQQLIDEIKHYLEKGKTKYPKSGGEPEFKKILAEKLREKNGLHDITGDEIVVGYGGQEALCLAFQLFTNETGAGFSPIWSVAVENFVPYSNEKFLEVPFNRDFTINWTILEDTVKKVSFFYLNNPHNPTGKVFTQDELARIVELCKKYNVFIISDEAYEDIIFDGKKHISTASLSEAQDYPDIISAFTFSKSFSATGLRVGYAVTKNKVAIKLMTSVQYTHTAGVPTFLQFGLLNSFKIDLSKMVKEFERRRDVLYTGLSQIEGIYIVKPEGTFFAYPDFSGVLNKLNQTVKKEIFDVLLENGICTVPGWAFTKNRYFLNNVRLSFSAANVQLLDMAVNRLKKLFA